MIRRAQNRDIPGINKLLVQVCNVHADSRPDIFKNGCKKYTDRELMEILEDDETPVFVFTDDRDEEVLGHCFCILESYRDHNVMVDRKTLYIDDICVSESERGKHIGSRLYRHAEEFARENGCYNVTLNVWSFNEKAARFYEAMGMTPYKTGMEYVL
ncbi:MAG: GNAT family N-acetyltransferase [Lachnospiraceae bacterium]|nr:GNAT family N-acetyltransferase [Lachnospiraceae bacterium]